MVDPEREVNQRRFKQVAEEIKEIKVKGKGLNYRVK